MIKKDTKTIITFAETLKELNEENKHKKLTLKIILTKLGGKGKILLAIFFCIPFGQILGLAVPFGLIIALLGFKMAFKYHKIWLPEFILRKRINQKIFKKILSQIEFPLKKLLPITHPRWERLSQARGMQIVNGCMIGAIGICLAISMPIPFSGWIASLAIFLLGLGMLNDDGVLLAIAYPLSIFYIALVVLTLYYISLADVYHWIRQFI